MPVEEALTRRPVSVVAAHPDDETVSAGGLLARMRGPYIIHVTNGAPRNPGDARRAGYESREDYAIARRRELLNALALMSDSGAESRPGAASPRNGSPEERPAAASGSALAVDLAAEMVICLEVIDQEASLQMADIARRLAAILLELRPGAILTHPYEGGHPDHDATAFAVHAACALIPAAPNIYEFTSYHAADLQKQEGGPGSAPHLEAGRFLPNQDAGEVITLSAEARELKTRMIDCFGSQIHMLRHFPVDQERFRAAPVYDFSQSPHPGKLFYEYFDWGMRGDRWRSLAKEAARALGLPERL